MNERHEAPDDPLEITCPKCGSDLVEPYRMPPQVTEYRLWGCLGCGADFRTEKER